MFAIYFEWVVKTGCEDEFARLWSAGTQALRGEGSLGSALFKSDDGIFHGFARWPDRETRDKAFAKRIRPDIFDPFADCIMELVQRREMDLLETQWLSEPC